MDNYQILVGDTLHYGNTRETRAGLALSLFNKQLSFSMQNGFPAVTIKKLYFESCVNELASFLRAETDASKMGSGIWLKDAERWSGGTDMGRVYGSQMREWRGPQGDIDQLRNVVDSIRDDPTSRRHLVSMWNPGELHLMCLPPCHYAFQFYVQGAVLDLAFHMRSVDVILGLPFDIAYYALLLHIVAQECKLVPGRLHANLGDTHIYTNHVAAANVMLRREPLDPPTLLLDPTARIDNFVPEMAQLKNYKHHDPVKAELNVG